MFIAACIILVYLGVIYPSVALYGARKLRNKESVVLFARVIGQKASDEYHEQYYWFGGISLLLVRNLLSGCASSSLHCVLANITLPAVSHLSQLDVPLIIFSEVIAPYRVDVSTIGQLVVLCAFFVVTIALRPFQMMFKNIGLCAVLLASICSVAEQIASASGQAIASTILSYVVFGLLIMFVAAAVCLIAWSAFVRRLWLIWKVTRAEKYGVGDEMQELGATEFASHHLYVAGLDDEPETPGGFTKLSSLDAMTVESKTDGVPLTDAVALDSPDSTPDLHLLAAESQPSGIVDTLPGQISDD